MTRAMLTLLTGVFLIAGCSSSNAPPAGEGGPQRNDEMQEVLALLGTHTAKGRKLKPTAAELAAYEQAFPLAVQLVRNDDVVVIWGVAPSGEGDIASGGGSTDIVAYEKKVESEGGWVVLQNGTTKQMTSPEFASATKAKK